MTCKKCKTSMPAARSHALETEDVIYALCHKCYVQFNTILSRRGELGEIMRRHLPLKVQQQLNSERRQAYAQAEVISWR